MSLVLWNNICLYFAVCIQIIGYWITHIFEKFVVAVMCTIIELIISNYITFWMKCTSIADFRYEVNIHYEVDESRLWNLHSLHLLLLLQSRVTSRRCLLTLSCLINFAQYIVNIITCWLNLLYCSMLGQWQHKYFIT